MPTIKINVVGGNTAGLRSFFQAIAADADASFNKLEGVSRLNIAEKLGISPNITRYTQAGSAGIGRMAVELDKFNNRLKLTSELGVKLANGDFFPTGKFTSYTGNIQQLEQALRGASISQEEFRSRIDQSRETINQAERALRDIRNISYNPGDPNTIRSINREIAQNVANIRNLQTALTAGTFSTRPVGSPERFQAELRVRREIAALEQRNANLAIQRGEAEARIQTVLEAEARTEQIITRENQAQLALTQRYNSQQAAIAAAINAPPPIPKNIQTVFNQAPQLAQLLQSRYNLGTTGAQLAEQQAKFNISRDLVRDVTRVTGSFVGANDVVQQFSAELDKNGKLVTRFGGQLSGVGSILNSIVRDFQKVIEWTVATTVVFGALRYAIEQLQTLKELDFVLQKFAITAQLSPRQAREEFEALASVALQTATPLVELVGAADDIALATRQAGQSTEEWLHDIESLTFAVGIFTNLTGTDTVKATDLLTASMKQLGINANEVVGIISKITAVAGGQSQAIADITQGLAVMAEAAKVGGLTVDQTIATVQVLSQVTAKTPAEIATAFKNLVGSLGSPAAIKALTNYEIPIKNLDGSLRNILEVYGDIQDKIRQGIIPQGEVQALVRAISGGPRRAPDAAALLKAIDQIAASQQRASKATNEAEIANAKAIDTTKAKLIQLQVLLDQAIFKEFGQGLRDGINALLNLLKGGIEVVNRFHGVFAGLFQIIAGFAVFKLGAVILGRFISFLIGTAQELRNVATSALAATQTVLGLNRALATTTATNTGLVGPNGQPLLAAAGAARAGFAGSLARGALGFAGAGALASGVTGANPIGGALQGLGGFLLLSPLTTVTGHFGLLAKGVGVAALALGTFISTIRDSNESLADHDEVLNRLIDSYQKFKDAGQSLDELRTQQKNLAADIKSLRAEEDQTPEILSRLADAQSQYAANVIETVRAQQTLGEASGELLTSFRELAKMETDESLKNSALKAAEILSNASKGMRVNADALNEAILAYQKILLRRSNPELNVDTAIPQPLGTRRGLSDFGSTTVAPNFIAQLVQNISGVRDYGSAVKDLTEITNEASKVTQLFSADGKTLLATFEPTAQNFAIISAAIQVVSKDNKDLAAAMAATIAQFKAQNDILAASEQYFIRYSAYLEALAHFNPEKAATGTDLLDFSNFITKQLASSGKLQQVFDPAGGAAFVTDIPNRLQEALRKFATTGEVDFKTLRDAATEFWLSLSEVDRAAITVDDILSNLLGDLFPSLRTELQDTAEAAKDAAEGLEKVGVSIQTDIAGKLGKLRADLQGGLIKQDEYNKEAARLKALMSLVTSVVSAYTDSITDIQGFNEVLKASQASFADIPGLEDAAILSTDAFIQRLFDLGETYGLNQKQLGDLTTALLNFRQVLENLAKLNIQIPIGLKLDVASVKAQIQKLINIINSQPRDESYANPELINLYSILRALEQAGDPLSTIVNQTRQIYASGSGTTSRTSGSTTTKTPTLDVSSLDIPEEIAEAVNRNALIQQAIQNALALQRSIPGEDQEAQNDIVALLEGTKNILEVRGVKEEYLRKALEELAEIEKKRLDFETKADQIRRIRIGVGDFSAIANVPINSRTGVSVGAPNQINITLSVNGTVLTPAQLAQFADLVGAALKKQIASG